MNELQFDFLEGDFVPPAERTVRQRGHAASPGTGPAGKTCRGCQHYQVFHGRYRKCALVGRLGGWTNSEATDIRAKDAACLHFMASL